MFLNFPLENRHYAWQTLLIIVAKTQVVTFTMSLFCSSVPISHLLFRKHAQSKDPESEAAKHNSSIIHSTTYDQKNIF